MKILSTLYDFFFSYTKLSFPKIMYQINEVLSKIKMLCFTIMLKCSCTFCEKGKTKMNDPIYYFFIWQLNSLTYLCPYK